MYESNRFWGDLVKSLRKELSMSQRVLATTARVHRATLRRIESGRTSGEMATMERIFDVLGYDLEALPLTIESGRDRQSRFENEEKTYSTVSKFMSMALPMSR